MSAAAISRVRAGENGFLRVFASQEALLAFGILGVAVLVGLDNPRFLAARNLSDIVLGNAYIAVAAIGMSMVIVSGNIDISVGSLSGGNQQKVVIAKWLMRQPRIILLNGPTRGIDVGTKQEIYQLLRRLADAGAAVVFYSTDYDELIGCCDRVLVLYDGQVVKALEGEALNEHALIASALNVNEKRKAAQ